MVKKYFTFIAATFAFGVNVFCSHASSATSSLENRMYDDSHNVIAEIMSKGKSLVEEQKVPKDAAVNCWRAAADRAERRQPHGTQSQWRFSRSFVGYIITALDNSESEAKRAEFDKLITSNFDYYEAEFSAINYEIEQDKKMGFWQKKVYVDCLKNIGKNRKAFARKNLGWLIDGVGAGLYRGEPQFRTFFDILYSNLKGYLNSKRVL